MGAVAPHPVIEGNEGHYNFQIHKTHQYWYLVLLIMVVALVLRLYQLGTESLWIDEGYSIGSSKSLGLAIKKESIRPLYFVILSFWLRLGYSEFILRLPSVLFGTAAVPVIYLLGKHLTSERVGLLASAILAVSPMQVNHSQEVRMYSLAVLLSLLAMYQFTLFLSHQKTGHLIGYLTFTVLSVATFPLTAILLFVQNLAAIMQLHQRGILLRRWISIQLFIIAPCIPLFIHTLHASQGMSLEQFADPSPIDVIDFIGSFSLLSNSPIGNPGWYAFYLYTSLMMVLATIGVLNARRYSKTWFIQSLMLLLWLFIPFILTGELAGLVGAQWLPRYVIYASPAFFLLLGIFVDTLPSRNFKYLAGVIILAFPILKLTHYYAKPTHPEWRQAVQYVMDGERPGDAIAVYRPGNGYVFNYYYHGKMPWREIGGVKIQKRRAWTDRRAASVIGDIPARHHRVWLVMSQYDPEAGDALENYIKSRYKVLQYRSYVGVEVFLFEQAH